MQSLKRVFAGALALATLTGTSISASADTRINHNMSTAIVNNGKSYNTESIEEFYLDLTNAEWHEVCIPDIYISVSQPEEKYISPVDKSVSIPNDTYKREYTTAEYTTAWVTFSIANDTCVKISDFGKISEAYKTLYVS